MDSWLNCARCGHRYKAFISACPRCGYSNYVRHGGSANRNNAKKIGIIAGASAVAVIAAFFIVPNLSSFSSNLPVSDSITTTSTSNNTEVTEEAEPQATVPVTQPEQNPPIASTSSIPAPKDIDTLRQYALQKINEDRADYGLSPVQLSDNQAAQAHAEDLYATQFHSTHWTSDGMKPYMKYTQYGGVGFVAQNVHAGAGYSPEDITACRIGLLLCERVDMRKQIEESEYSMMYDDAHANWGHRDNILDKHHTNVSIGIMYDDFYFAFVQNFENQYIDWSQPTTYNSDSSEVSMRGTFADSIEFSAIQIFYDPPPTPALYEEHKEDTSYSLGDFVGIVAEPLPPGAFYQNTDEFVLTTADEWRLDGQSFEFSFSMNKLYEKYEKGVYTVVLLAEKQGETVPITNFSVFNEN